MSSKTNVHYILNRLKIDFQALYFSAAIAFKVLGSFLPVRSQTIENRFLGHPSCGTSFRRERFFA